MSATDNLSTPQFGPRTETQARNMAALDRMAKVARDRAKPMGRGISDVMPIKRIGNW